MVLEELPLFSGVGYWSLKVDVVGVNVRESEKKQVQMFVATVREAPPHRNQTRGSSRSVSNLEAGSRVGKCERRV